MPKIQPIHTDTLYAQPMETITDFVFDEVVVRVFPDMLPRSVGAYETVVKITGSIAAGRIRTGASTSTWGAPEMQPPNQSLVQSVIRIFPS